MEWVAAVGQTLVARPSLADSSLVVREAPSSNLSSELDISDNDLNGAFMMESFTASSPRRTRMDGTEPVDSRGWASICLALESNTGLTFLNASGEIVEAHLENFVPHLGPRHTVEVQVSARLRPRSLFETFGGDRRALSSSLSWRSRQTALLR